MAYPASDFVSSRYQTYTEVPLNRRLQFRRMLDQLRRYRCQESRLASAMTAFVYDMAYNMVDDIGDEDASTDRPPPPPTITMDTSEIDLREFSRGPGEMTWEQTPMQKLIRRWVAATGRRESANVGQFKPDICDRLSLQTDDAEYIVIGLVGERKVVLTTMNHSGRLTIAHRTDSLSAPDTSHGSSTGSASLGTRIRWQTVSKWREGLSKAIIYLITAYQCFGTTRGIVHITSAFSRIRLIHDDPHSTHIVLEVGNSFANSGETIEAGAFLDNDDNHRHLAHDLCENDGSGSPSPATHTWFNTHRDALNELIALRVLDDERLERIPESSLDVPFASHCRFDASSHREVFDIVRQYRNVEYDTPSPAAIPALGPSRSDHTEDPDVPGEAGDEPHALRRSARLHEAGAITGDAAGDVDQSAPRTTGRAEVSISTGSASSGTDSSSLASSSVAVLGAEDPCTPDPAQSAAISHKEPVRQDHWVEAIDLASNPLPAQLGHSPKALSRGPDQRSLATPRSRVISLPPKRPSGTFRELEVRKVRLRHSDPASASERSALVATDYLMPLDTIDGHVSGPIDESPSHTVTLPPVGTWDALQRRLPSPPLESVPTPFRACHRDPGDIEDGSEMWEDAQSFKAAEARSIIDLKSVRLYLVPAKEFATFDI